MADKGKLCRLSSYGLMKGGTQAFVVKEGSLRPGSSAVESPKESTGEPIRWRIER